MRPLDGRCGGAVCSRGGNAAEWDRGSVRAGGCGRVDGVARRGQDRGGGSRVVRDHCLGFLRAQEARGEDAEQQHASDGPPRVAADAGR